MKITILEGARGLGKSTVSRILRDGMTNTLLINMTGNNLDSEKGMEQTFKHYENFLTLLYGESFDDSPFNYLFDRTFFSEQVYSTLYKSYNFTPKFEKLIKKLDKIANRHDVTVIHLVANKETIERNLGREGKAHLFGDERFADSVHKSLEQQAMYEQVMKQSKMDTHNITFKRLEVSNLTLDEVVKFVKSEI